MTNLYTVTNAGQLIDEVETTSLETCKQYLIKSGYTEENVIDFSYQIKGGNNGINAIPFNREFETVINPLKYWAIRPGTLFFTVQQFENVDVQSHLMVKLNDESCMITDLGIKGQIDKDADVYLVLKNG